MPNVTALPRTLENGRTLTQFTDTTSTSAITYTYPAQQTGIQIENSGEKDIFVTVGSYTNQLVKADTKWKVDVSFTSFSISSGVNSQEFIATAFAGVVTDTNTIATQLAEIMNKYRLDTNTPELFDKTVQVTPNIIDNYYLDNNGNQNALTSYAISTYITVNPNALYFVNQIAAGQTLYGCWYDSSHNFISSLSGQAAISPVNASFVRLNINKTLTFSNYSFRLMNNTLGNWSGKKANFLGDSITFGYPGVSTIPNPYHALVKTMLGLSVARNYGVTGSNIQTTTGDNSNSFTNRYGTMDNDADLIFVFGGTNDFGHNLPLGTTADTSDVSFYGALSILMNGLINKYPFQTIVFATPLHRNFVDSGNSSGGETNNGSVTLLQYVNALKDRAQKYGFPVLDLYSMSGMQPNNDNQKGLFTTDGLHPNQLGHQVIANKIVGFLNTI